MIERDLVGAVVGAIPRRPAAGTGAAPAATRPAARGRLGRVLLGLALPIGLLALWQLTTSLGVFSVVQLPPFLLP